MTPDPKVIATLPLPDDLELTFRTTVGELRQMLLAGAAQAGRKDLSLEEFAARIDRAVSTARGLCSRGLVPGAYKLNGRDWKIPEASLDAYLNAQSVGKQREEFEASITTPSIRLDSWRDEIEQQPAPRRVRRAVGE